MEITSVLVSMEDIVEAGRVVERIVYSVVCIVRVVVAVLCMRVMTLVTVRVV